MIDEVKIFLYDIRDLGVGYIDSLNNNPYRMPVKKSRLVGAESIWLCEDGSDEKDNHTISLYGSAYWDDFDPGEGDYSLNVNGFDYGASVQSINYTSTFTLTGIARKYGGNDDACIMATAQSNDGWKLLYDAVDDRLGFESGDGTSTETVWGDEMEDLSGSDWFMWMAVVDYDNETVQFYINGADAGDGTITYTPSTYTSIAMTGINFSDLEEFFGELDAIQVYTRNLTSDDASTINDTPGIEIEEMISVTTPFTFDATDITFDNTNYTFDATKK